MYCSYCYKYFAALPLFFLRNLIFKKYFLALPLVLNDYQLFGEVGAAHQNACPATDGFVENGNALWN